MEGCEVIGLLSMPVIQHPDITLRKADLVGKVTHCFRF